MRDFDAWLAGFRPSIADYKYYVDFDKVFNNVEAIKIPLNILNALIGSKNIEDEFRNILVQYPETLKCIPILLAKRELDIMAMDEEGQIDFHFDKPNCTNEDYVKFMRKTGLFDLMENHIVNNLVDYVTGIETGLDSNGRKNRGGHLMENLVEGFLCKAGLVKGETYFKEMYIHEIEAKWGIDLSSISNNGRAEKRFDFVVKGKNTVYGIETNFYTSIIRKTKCFDFWERNVLFPKTKRSFFRTPTPLPCPFPLNFSLLIITKKFGNLAKNRYICIV